MDERRKLKVAITIRWMKIRGDPALMEVLNFLNYPVVKGHHRRKYVTICYVKA